MAQDSKFQPNASTVVKGVVQIATQAEVNAQTATGSTGATLVIPASATLGSGLQNASTTAKGAVQLATDAEVAARTATGSTGAALVMPNAYVFKGCRVYKTADQAVSSGGGPVKVTWNAENFDTDTMHDNVTNNTRITFKTAGIYVVLFQLNYTSTPAEISASILLNNTTQIAKSSVQQTTFNCDVLCGTIYSFAVNDYIEARIEPNTSADVNQASFFTAYSLL